MHGDPMGLDWTRATHSDQVLFTEEYQSHLYRILGLKEILPHHDKDFKHIIHALDGNGHHTLLVMHELMDNL